MVDDKKNLIAQTLSVIGVVFIVVGVISGLSYGTGEGSLLGEAQSILGWGLFINGVIWGVLFLGFAEVIKLLQGIYNQGRKNEEIAQAEVEPVQEKLQEKEKEEELIDVIPQHAQNEINDHFKGQTIEKIRKTAKEDVYIVTVNQQNVVIELGGFKPVVIPENKAKELGLI